MRISFTRFGLPVLLLLLLLPAGIHVSSQAQGQGVTERMLNVLVPGKPVFTDFADCTDPANVRGFAIDVFQSALAILRSPSDDGSQTYVQRVNYTCYNISATTSYNDLVDALKDEPEVDAAIGDLTISAQRLEKASFTQPFLDSGIVILTPAAGVTQPFPSVFVKPFTNDTWKLVVLSFFSTGIAFAVLEFRTYQLEHRADMTILQKLRKMSWFVLTLLVFFKRESLRNPLSKIVLIVWILFIFILGSGYIASFSSILTVWELSKETLDIATLLRKNLTVGYQVGSIVGDYLKNRSGISNVVELNDTKYYKEALSSGKVSAIVEELPYVSLFLSEQPAADCIYAVSSKLTTGGFGFAFRDYNLSVAFSIAILNLSENGQLQKIQDGSKLSDYACPAQVQSTQLDVQNSAALFILLGSACLVCVLAFVIKRVRYNRAPPSNDEDGQLGDLPDSSGSIELPPYTHLHVRNGGGGG